MNEQRELQGNIVIESLDGFLGLSREIQEAGYMFTVVPPSGIGYVFDFGDGSVTVSEDVEDDEYRSERFASVEEALDEFSVDGRSLREIVVGSKFIVPEAR